MGKRKVLFVDDEPSIRLTLPAILGMHGYEVQSAATVVEALAAIHKHSFDVLIADLNIGEPGDGFTVVSAMRRTQPQAITLILTGYPAFETALEAIRQQVDDYVVKPADIDSLVKNIEEKLAGRKNHDRVPPRRAALLLREQAGDVISHWLRTVEGNASIARVSLSRSERSDHVPEILSELLAHLENDHCEITAPAIESALRHGRIRRLQSYSATMLVEEARILRACIMRCVRDHLLSIDVSYVVNDLSQIDFVLDGMLVESVRGFLEAEEKAA